MNQELVDALIKQSREMIQADRDQFDNWQAHCVQLQDIAQQMMQHLHSMKGGFAFFGLPNISAQAHHIEDVLQQFTEQMHAVLPQLRIIFSS